MVGLNDGHAMPRIGLGTSGIWDDEAPRLVGQAIEAGYGLVDTASCYCNEVGIGEALRANAPGRPTFLTTKVWNTDHGYDETRRAFEASRARLGLETIDLYLIHWPVPSRSLFVDSWRAMIELREAGKIRSIGVCNFTVPQLRHLIAATTVVPAVNQIELHPRFQQREQRAFHAEAGIVTQAWSPLGLSKALGEPAVRAIAHKHGKSPAQVVLRWHIQAGHTVVPKSSRPVHLRGNLDILDFDLDTDDLRAMDALDDPAGRLGPHPDRFGIEGRAARWKRRLASIAQDPSNFRRRLKRLTGR